MIVCKIQQETRPCKQCFCVCLVMDWVRNRALIER